MVLIKPGQASIVAGTSGVIFAVTDKKVFQKEALANTFVHSVPDIDGNNVYGVLVCLNSAGNAYRLLNEEIGGSYDTMNNLAENASPGSGGLTYLHYTNGGERTFRNKSVDKANFVGSGSLSPQNKCRATLESISSWYRYASEIVKDMGVEITEAMIVNDGLARSRLFCDMIADSLGSDVTIYDSSGARGALIGIKVALGHPLEEAYKGISPIETINPSQDRTFREGMNLAYGTHMAACRNAGLISP
jgi:xylulokinase